MSDLSPLEIATSFQPEPRLKNPSKAEDLNPKPVALNPKPCLGVLHGLLDGSWYSSTKSSCTYDPSHDYIRALKGLNL